MPAVHEPRRQRRSRLCLRSAAPLLGLAAAVLSLLLLLVGHTRGGPHALAWTLAAPAWGAIGGSALATARPASVRRTAASVDVDADVDVDVDEEDADLSRVPVEEFKVGEGPIPGIVNAVVDFGAFVDVGAERDGLVPIQHITGGFIKDIRQVVKEGQEVDVWVTSTKDGKLGLSMVKDVEAGREKPLPPRSNVAAFESLPPTEWCDGVVEKVMRFGLIVKVKHPSAGTRAPGLVHIHEIRDAFVTDIESEASVGDQVKVRILGVQKARGNLKLTMKSVGKHGADSFEAFSEQDPLEWLEGRVHHTAPFGCFVDVQLPGGGTQARGFVHSTMMGEWVDDPAEEVSPGQAVQVRVLEVDLARRRMLLSMMPP